MLPHIGGTDVLVVAYNNTKIIILTGSELTAGEESGLLENAAVILGKGTFSAGEFRRGLLELLAC